MVPSATGRPCLAPRLGGAQDLDVDAIHGEMLSQLGSRGRPCVADFERRAVAGRDLAYDGEAQPAAGARGAGHAVEAFQNALALLGRDALAVILDFR